MGLEKGKQASLLQGCLMEPKGRLQPGSPGYWNDGCGGNQWVTPLSSLSLALPPSVPATALFLSPNTGYSCISAHKTREGCLTALGPYIASLQAQFLGKRFWVHQLRPGIRSPVQSWQRGLSSHEGESLRDWLRFGLVSPQCFLHPD